MAAPNYTLWKAAADKGEVRRVTWVCGDQPVLIEEIVSTTVRMLTVSELDLLSFRAGSVADREIWAAAGQYPLTDACDRLVIVREAQRMKRWEPLTEWLSQRQRLPRNYLLFIADGDDFDTVTVDGRKVIAPHIEQVRASRGRLVRCGLPNEGDAVAWLRSRAPMSEATARYVLKRVGHDLRLAADVAGKVKLFGGNPGESTIDALCQVEPADSFADALVGLDREDALRALPGLADADRVRVLRLLESRLDILSLLWKANRARTPVREITDVPAFLLHKLMPVARHYPPEKCVKARSLLAATEVAHRGGARTGVFESLIALW